MGVRSDNPTGAENQQERPSCSSWLDEIADDVGNYVAGFVDGEGSFNVPIRRSIDRGLPYRVGLSFNVSQQGPDAGALLRQVFGVGTVRDRGDGIHYYEVTRPDHLAQRVFPFFERFPLRLAKAGDLQRFREITARVQSGSHLTVEGLIEIVKLRSSMNRGGKRRRTDDEIIEAVERFGILRGHTQGSLTEAEG